MGSVLAAVMLLFAPGVPWWGERHEVDPNKGSVRLNPNKALEQTFTWEEGTIDTVLLWLKPDERPTSGNIHLVITGDGGERDVLLPITSAPASGVAVFSLPSPLSARKNSPGTVRVTWRDSRVPLYFLFQIDSTKFPGGELQQRPGDLGFQLRYVRPPLGSQTTQVASASMVLVGGLISAWVLKRVLQQTLLKPTGWYRDALIASALGILVAIFYGVLLIRPGIWIGPGDFTKDVAYVQASVAAFTAGQWPTWSHLLCGGLPLLANPESNSLSLATLLGFFLRSEHALLLLLALEAGIGAAGTYALARGFKLSRLGSVAATAIASLSAVYAYRLSEGFSMTGGAIAFTPWAFFGFWQAIHRRRWWGVLLTGTSLGLMFLRGEVHIIVGVIGVLVLWASWYAVAKRSTVPLQMLCGVGAVTLMWSVPKLLAYIEHGALFTSHLPLYVVKLWQTGWWDDVFLAAHSREVKVPVRFGTEEHWGNFGAYTGWLPWALAAVALLRRGVTRWLLAVSLLVLLVISEGTLFSHVAPTLGPIGTLLRLPTRLLSIATLLLGIMAGQGVTMLVRRWQYLGSVAAILIVGALIIDLGRTDVAILQQNFNRHLPVPAAVVTGGQLAAHRNAGVDPTRHPSQLLAAGYVLPQLCADLNVDHPFTDNRPAVWPLSSLPTTLLPNAIVVEAPPVTTDVFLQENFTDAWVVDHGMVLASSEKSIQLITPAQPFPRLTLSVANGTARTQQVVLVLMLGTALLFGGGLIARWRRILMAPSPETPAPGRGRPLL